MHWTLAAAGIEIGASFHRLKTLRPIEGHRRRYVAATTFEAAAKCLK